MVDGAGVAWWNSFLENFEGLYGSFPSPQPTWLLEILKTRVIPVVPIDPAIPEMITTMHKSQMESHPKVNIILFILLCDKMMSYLDIVPKLFLMGN